MICPNCKNETSSIRSAIRKREIVTGCDNCLDEKLQQPADTTAKFYKRAQQTKFRRELTQPVAPREFLQAYGPEAARRRGYSEDMIRKYSN